MHFGGNEYARGCGSRSPFALWRALLVPLAHHHRYAARELSPVRVQAATPAGGEPGEEPRLGFTGPVTGALPLSRHAVARLLQLDVLDQVAPKRRPAGLLNVEEHHHIIPPDVKVNVPVQVALREVKFGRDFGGKVLVRLRLAVNQLKARGVALERPLVVTCEAAGVTVRRAHVLVTDHEEEHRRNGDEDESAELLLHGGNC